VSKFDFDILLPASQEKLIDIVTDYKNFQRFFPQQIKHINILKSNEHETVTEEVLFFSTMFLVSCLSSFIIENALSFKDIH